MHPDEAPESQLFLRLAEPFGRGPLRHMTPEAIAAATAVVKIDVESPQ